MISIASTLRVLAGAGLAVAVAGAAPAAPARTGKAAPAKARPKAAPGKPGSTAAPAKPNPAAAFPFPSGRVVYKMKSPMLNGTSTLRWIENGRLFRQDLDAAFGGPQRSTRIRSWAISDGKYLYMSQTGAQSNVVNRMKLPKNATSVGSPAGMPMIASSGNQGKLLGMTTILGRPCEIRQIQEMKICTWKGLGLRMEGGPAQGPGMSMEATSIQTPARIAPSMFKVPAGYKVQDFNANAARMSGPPGGPPPARPGPR